MSSLSVGGIIFAFGGFQSGIILAGEKKSAKNIPLATLSAFSHCHCFIYFNPIVFIVAVPNHLLADGWRQLNFTGDLGPLQV